MRSVAANVSAEACKRVNVASCDELVGVLSELISALETLPEIQRSGERLLEIEKQITAITRPEELGALQSRIREHLVLAGKEALQQRQQISDLVSGAIGRLQASQERIGRAVDRGAAAQKNADPLTGLPARSYAEIELSRIQSQGTPRHVLMFVVKRLQYINARLGFSRGDQVLLRVAQYLAQSLAEFSELLRWTGCSFLAIAPEEASYQDLRQKAQVIALQRLTPTLEWEGHSALIPVSLDWQIVQLGEFESPEALFLRLDGFATGA